MIRKSIIEYCMLKPSLLYLMLIIILSPLSKGFSNEIDSIENFNKSLSVKTFMLFSDLDLDIDTNYENEDPRISYNPNTGLAFGIEIFYYDFGFSFYKSSNADEKEKCGNTKFIDFQLSYYQRKYAVDCYYQNYKGFYLDRPEDFGLVEGESETIRSDINMISTGLNIFYIFSDDFSFKAAFNQLERQNKWDWSFLLMGSFNYLSIDSDYSLIPDNYQLYYGKYASLTGGSFTSINILPGIGVTIPVYKFYVTSSIFFGAGLMNKCYETESEKIKKIGSLSRGNFRLSSGYNGDTIFTGFTFYVDVTDTKTWASSSNEPSIRSFTFNGSLFIGCRFDL